MREIKTYMVEGYTHPQCTAKDILRSS